MPEWMRRVLSCKFNSACAAHDSAYSAGLMSREEIDRKFLKDMLILAGPNPFCVLMAYAYYLMARIGGKSRYQRSDIGKGV